MVIPYCAGASFCEAGQSGHVSQKFFVAGGVFVPLCADALAKRLYLLMERFALFIPGETIGLVALALLRPLLTLFGQCLPDTNIVLFEFIPRPGHREDARVDVRCLSPRSAWQVSIILVGIPDEFRTATRE